MYTPMGCVRYHLRNFLVAHIAFFQVIFGAKHCNSFHSLTQTRGVVPTNGPHNKSRGQVSSCRLAIFATKSSRRDQILVPAASPSNSNWFEFWDNSPELVPQNALRELFVGQLSATMAFV